MAKKWPNLPKWPNAFFYGQRSQKMAKFFEIGPIWQSCSRNLTSCDTAVEHTLCTNQIRKQTASLPPSRCQAKFLTCEISDFTTCTHAQTA